jgi:hypothetical protein
MKVFEPAMRAKLVLITSLLLNLFLVGEVFRLKGRQPQGAIIRGEQAPGETLESAAPSFRWSQIESTDYPKYIANLRAIGCPEQTIREIIATDLSDLYAPRRESLQRLANKSATATDRGEAERTLDQLRQEEMAVFRRLFGIPDPKPAETLASASALPAEKHQTEVEDVSPTMPLVFQLADTHVVNLTAEEREAVGQVRDSFRAALGTNQDVNSSEYLHSWQLAQRQADSLLDALIGRQAWLKYEDALQREKPNGD